MMHHQRRRKKHAPCEIKTFELVRGPKGYGFTIGGQLPCVLSTINPGSPAEKAGMQAGDYLIAVNGRSVSMLTHDEVVQIIGQASGTLILQVAGVSDSSDAELSSSQKSHLGRAEKVVRDLQSGILFIDHQNHKMLDNLNQSRGLLDLVYQQRQKLQETMRSKTTRSQDSSSSVRLKRMIKRKVPNSGSACSTDSSREKLNEFDEESIRSRLGSNSHKPKGLVSGSKELITRAIVGYLGTIEIPKAACSKQLLKNCIKRLQTEKKVHTTVFFIVYSNCVLLTASSGIVLARFPLERITFCGVYLEDKKFFGLVTSHGEASEEEENEEPPSQSCHVFMVDSRISDHRHHLKYNHIFSFECIRRKDGGCEEFPRTAATILQSINSLEYNQLDFPCNQGSTSSTSDSGLGLREEAPLRRLRTAGMAAAEVPPRRHSMPPPGRRAPQAEATARAVTPPPSPGRQIDPDLESPKHWARSSSLRRNVNRKRSLRLNRDAGTVSDGEVPETQGGGGYLDLEKSPLRRSSELPTQAGKVASWATGFEKLLSDPNGLRVFTEFLEKEFSQENILFWGACEEYRKLTDVAKMREKAQDIFQHHLASGAAEPVNVDGRARLMAQDGLDDPQPDLFQLAQSQIFNLMKFDCYQRFLKSQLFKDCLVKEMHGQVVEEQPSGDKPDIKVDDKKRKSLIPWHILSKPGSSRSADLGKGSKVQQGRADSRKSVKKKKSKENVKEDSSSDLTSSRSSLASADLAPPPLRHGTTREELDMGRDVASLGCREIRVEQRCLLWVVLPCGRAVAVRTTPRDCLGAALRPLLPSLNLPPLDHLTPHTASGPISFTAPSVNLDAQRIVLLPKDATDLDQTLMDKLLMPDPLTSRQFEKILGNKSQAAAFNRHGFLELEPPHKRPSGSRKVQLPRCNSLELGTEQSHQTQALEVPDTLFTSATHHQAGSPRRSSEPPPIPPKAQTRGPPPRPPARLPAGKSPVSFV